MIFYPLKSVKNFFYTITSPIASGLNKISSSASGFFADLGSIGRLSADNKKLTEENNLLEAEVAKLKEYKHENEILKKELGFVKDAKGQNLVAAKIISKQITPFLENILIDQGKKDGVAENQIVLSQGHLVGIVDKTFDDYSEVNLITSSTALIPVVLQNSRSSGLLKSKLEGLFIENIPIAEDVKQGEAVLTSNLSENIPQDILIGKVEKITKYESQIFQTIKVRSPIEFSQLEFVFVVKN